MRKQITNRLNSWNLRKNMRKYNWDHLSHEAHASKTIIRMRECLNCKCSICESLKHYRGKQVLTIVNW